MILSLTRWTTWLRSGSSFRGLSILFASVLASFCFHLVFLSEVLAPRLLHMPEHHCPYDLLPRAPLSVLPIMFFLSATFCVGWGCVVGWLGKTPEADSGQRQLIASLFRVGLVGYGSAVLAVSLLLAIS
jgi:hypothetical protein